MTETAIGATPGTRRRRMPLTIAVSIAFLAFIVILALGADWIAPYGYATQDLKARMRPPIFFGGDLGHILGTDNLGRDILSRTIYGARASILIAVCGTAIGALFGTTLGIVAAHFRGLTEEILMMLVDLQAAIPNLVLALAVLAFIGNDLTVFVILVGLDGWERYARLARGLILSAKESGYVQSMHMIGASAPRIYLGQILPNIAGALVVQLTLNFPGTIILETALSFLGLGVQPPLTSLGQMLGHGRTYLLNAWWMSVIPGLVIFATTMSVCLIGDWLRDRLDSSVAVG